MKKIQIIIACIILFSASIHAQNVGIGTTAPSHKLHIKGQVRIDTLVSGLATDSILVADPATGLLKRVSAAKILSGNTTNTMSNATNTITSTVNGIAATAPAVNTVSNTFNSTTRALTTTVNGVAGTSVTLTDGIDSTTASNGLTLNGKDVRLGGTLSSNTTITQGTNLMTFTGTPSSSNASMITLSNTATGANGTVLLDMLTPNSDVSYFRLGKATTFGNSAELTYRNIGNNSDSNSFSLGFFNSQYLVNLTKSGNLGIGANLFLPTQKLDVDGGARIRTLASGSTTDSIVTADANGVLRRRSITAVLSAATTNTLTAGSNSITNTTNGVSATLIPSAGTITTKFLGFDASGNLVTDTALTVANNIYNTDGTLTGNRTVNQGSNSITFTGSIVNSFSVDGSTLSVDGANNRVGIGTTTPGESLDVRGNARIGNNDTSNYIAFRGLFGDGAGTYDHTFIGERRFGGVEQTELLIYKGNDTGNIEPGPDRIRLLAAEHRFDTYGAATAGSFETVARSTNNTNRMIIKGNGNVGIGTSDPTNTMDINGTARIRTLTSGAASDSIVTADANGVLRRRSISNVLSDGNIVSTQTITVPALSIGDAGSVTVTIAGATTTSSVVVNPVNDMPNGVAIAYARVSAANTVKIGFIGSGSSASFSSDFLIRVIR